MSISVAALASSRSFRPLAVSLLIFSMPAGAARAEGEFLQLDAARDSRTAVASVERRRLTYSATYYGDDEARVLGASVLYRLSSAAEGAPVTVKFRAVPRDDRRRRRGIEGRGWAEADRGSLG